MITLPRHLYSMAGKAPASRCAQYLPHLAALGPSHIPRIPRQCHTWFGEKRCRSPQFCRSGNTKPVECGTQQVESAMLRFDGSTWRACPALSLSCCVQLRQPDQTRPQSKLL
eukprot:364974-Chlamydomonas_euryale.AAC.9